MKIMWIATFEKRTATAFHIFCGLLKIDNGPHAIHTVPSEHKEAGLLIETKEGPRVRKLPGQVNG